MADDENTNADDAPQESPPPAVLDLKHLTPEIDEDAVAEAAQAGAINADAQGDPVLTNGKPEWSPPLVDAATGIALDGHDLPVNHRLRAETLVATGKTTDPAGEITDDLIAETKARLQAEAQGS